MIRKHPTSDPLTVRWDRTVIHPDNPSEDTIVCCLAEDGRPVALMLDAELREALGLSLVDPGGEGDQAEESARDQVRDELRFYLACGTDERADALLDAYRDQVRVETLREAGAMLATAFGDPMVKHVGALGAAVLRRRAREAEAELRRMADGSGR